MKVHELLNITEEEFKQQQLQFFLALTILEQSDPEMAKKLYEKNMYCIQSLESAPEGSFNQ